MFGNNFSEDELLKSYFDSLNKLKMKKKASLDAQAEESPENMRPEDYLVDSPSEPAPIHELDDKISDVESYAKDEDESCPKCGEVHENECMALDQEKTSCPSCGEVHENECMAPEDKMVILTPVNADDAKLDDEDDWTKDHSYLMDSKAKEVLEGLGKIAAELRQKDKGFAADMVEVTATKIKDEALKEAYQKLKILDGLKKMANVSYEHGDKFAGDVITATIESIKKEQ